MGDVFTYTQRISSMSDGFMVEVIRMSTGNKKYVKKNQEKKEERNGKIN